MNITKTEVLRAIANCERHAGFSPIDNAPISACAITRGDLLTVIEAAKCARFEAIDGYKSATSTSGAILDYRNHADRDYCK